MQDQENLTQPNVEQPGQIPGIEQSPSITTPSNEPAAIKAQNRKPIFALIVVAVAVLAGVGLYLLTKQDPISSSKAPTNQQSAAMQTEVSNLAYVTVHEGTSSRLLQVDSSSGHTSTLLSLASSKDPELLNVIKTSDGLREFFSIDKTDGNNVTQGIGFQNNGAQLKSIYNNAYNNQASSVTQTIKLPGGVSPKGDSIDIYEYSQNSYAIKRVSLDSSSWTVISGDSTKPRVDGEKALLLIPDARSQDGNTIYLSAHSCWNCDGPSYADLVALDTVTKKYTILFKDPNDTFAGSWQKINDHLFWMTSTSVPDLGAPSYEEILKAKTYFYIYDTNTNTSKKVFETDSPDNILALVSGRSQDGKTVYVSIEGAKIGKAIIGNKEQAGQHDFTFVPKEIRAYDSATGDYKAVNLPGFDPAKQSVAMLYSVAGNYIYSLQATDNSVGPTLYTYNPTSNGKTAQSILKAAQYGYFNLVSFDSAQ